MSDDEEVVLAESELHKYMKMNHDALDVRVSELVNSGPINQKSLGGDFTDQHEQTSFTSTTKEKFVFSENYSNFINDILNTGLLYPDHIIDLERHLSLVNVVKSNNIKRSSIMYGTFLTVSSTCSLITNSRLLQCAGFVAATFCGYKLYRIAKLYSETKEINLFTKSIENLFSMNKKVLSFILESEFILRSKIIKDQQVYVPSNGWVDLNTTSGLINSRLLVPELRKMLMNIYLDVINLFNNFLISMRGNLYLDPAIEDNIELPEEFYTFQRQGDFTPSSEDLKKLSTVYLLMQSEFLKRTILSFVESVWANKVYRENTLSKLALCTKSFVTYTSRLKFQYLRCVSEIKNRSCLSIKSSSTLQAGNLNSKLYIFIKNFLTKADAHVLSLFLDLKMVNDWVNEFEENNKDNNSDPNVKLIEMLHERLQQLKSNLESFTNLYNDNCNLLRSMAVKTNESCQNVIDVEKLNDSVTITGIEVGKSDFQCLGRDEVLISLINCDDDKGINEVKMVDYEEEVVKKSLPRSVLNELKCVLKDKKEEWIERERKATVNQNFSLDSLDFDNLMSSSHNDYTLSDTDNSSLRSDQRNNVASKYREADDSLHTKVKISDLQSNNQQNSTNNEESLYFSFDANNSDVTTSCDDSLLTTCDVSFRPSNFVDQIKLAQRSFNLNSTEEQILGDSSEDEED